MKSSTRRRIRFVLAYGAIALVFVLGVASRLKNAPKRAIGDLEPIHGFSRVRLSGELTRPPIRLGDGAMMFPLDDGTGSLAVFVETRIDGPQPKGGDRVEVEGYLYVGAGADRRLRVTESSWVRVERKEASFLGETGAQVVARGTVVRTWRPEEGSRAPYRISMETEAGEVEIVHWLPKLTEPRTNTVIEVTGRVDEYRGEKRIKLYAGEDLRPLD